MWNIILLWHAQNIITPVRKVDNLILEIPLMLNRLTESFASN